ncbi:hypothetical protein DFAR_3200019 [Desulfarculales bacterium]
MIAVKNLFVAESHTLDDKGREIARSSGHFVKRNITLSLEIGYA